jgi:uncharacterized protein YndB with AHSA1/START domain
MTGGETMETMIEKAEVTLPSDSAVLVTRSFRAPRSLVYRAHTEPALIRQWMLGPPGWSMPICEMDVRVGGNYRWRWRSDKDGKEFGFSGTFREVEPNVRLVHTESFDPGTTAEKMADSPSLVTLTLSGDGVITTISSLIDFGTKANRDAALATGMTNGMEQSYQLLDGLLGERADS